MVSIGVAAAWGVHHASKRINFSDRLLRRLPLASAGLVGVLGAIMLVQGSWISHPRRRRCRKCYVRGLPYASANVRLASWT